MSAFAPYRLMTEEEAPAARLGLVVLQTDEVLETDLRRLFEPDAIALHITRIPSGAEVTPEALSAMEAALPAATALLPPGRYDAIGYGCTSGTVMIGAERVATLIQGAAETGTVVTPLTAAADALAALGARRIGLLSPYIASVSAPMEDAFAGLGIETVSRISFGEETEARVARIAPASIRAAAQALAQTPGVEALFLSCTNLAAHSVIDALEAETGLPVVTSNLALAWALARAGDVALAPGAPGRLTREEGTTRRSA